MKSLYFVGNEELWNDAWFQALVESLKSRSISVVLLDNVQEAIEVQNRIENLSVYERMVFNKGLDPVALAKNIGFKIPEVKLSLILILTDEVNPNAYPRQLAWGTASDDFLSAVGLSEISQVIEDAFIFDDNLAGEVSKAIQSSDGSLVDANLLTADVAELEKLIEHKTIVLQKPGEEEATIAVPEEPKLVHEESVQSLPVQPEEIQLEVPVAEANEEVSLASDFLSEAFNEKVEEEAKPAPDQTVNKTVLIKPVEVAAPAVIAVASPEEASAPQFSEASKPVAPAAIEVSQLLSSMSHSVSGEDIEVLKRYASIKERELRESQAATEALRRQIKYFDERLKKSEEERRKLLLKLEETDNELRTVADKKDENKAQLRTIENRYEEKIKELLVQLESSQFQAGKLEKKLIDFKERVRNDLQKIRSRERELASRLEIQKRDAEALLSAKDERLLNQKREMDRLEFDMDSLKERLLDDAQKNEEKRKRVARALQSLKLAQSILSGLEEDIVAKDEKDKAA